MAQASTSDESNKIEITVECEHEIVKNYMINISICDIYQVWHCWTLDEVYTMDLRNRQYLMSRRQAINSKSKRIF